ncbi:MAG TPA: ATP-binding protein [Solirubrobacteraceae bacterium]|jgi:predicted AAA+ superfamily ATPase|nr:ATP-binding protein [Solirubrobacteraceae bacterium]
MQRALVERNIRSTVVEALGEARAVCLLGARQSGKSTLARAIAEREHPAEYLTLDNDPTRRSALEDPTGFIAGVSGPVVIDEVQRAPDLMLAIKERLDTNNERGQFLLAGSANILALPSIADALPGRVDYVWMWPFSQGELNGRRESFVDGLLAGEAPHVDGAEVGRGAYALELVAGGFPEAQERSARGRARFFTSYISTLLGRDLPDIAKVRESATVERLLRILAARSAGLLSVRSIAAELGVDHKTVASQAHILEELFLVWRLQPWHVNLGSRQVKTPKIHMIDTGLLTHLLNIDAAGIVASPTLAGPIFETFAAMELARQCDWAESAASMFHYRDKQQREVDIVLELGSGEVAGVEVKTAATVTAKDFAGLRYLRNKLGGRFKAGVVLYTGKRSLSFGDRLTAVPLCGLWS